MTRKLVLLSLMLVALATLAVPVGAQAPILPQQTDPTWQAYYFGNTALTGNAVLIRAESDLNHDWGSGSPDAQVPADSFSARWTKYIDVFAGTYTFSATTDDGVRLWVNGQLIIDQWTVHPATTYTTDIYLPSGHHLVKVEYFEQTGLASAKVDWYPQGQAPTPPPTPPPPPPTGDWTANYYNNTSMSGTPVLTRNEAAINYNWGSGSPASGVPADNFSAKWTRSLSLAAGTYTFSVTADDGVRLWVNNHLLIDAWKEQAATTYAESIYLPGGAVPVELQYFEKGGMAVAKLSWAAGSVTPPPVAGTVIVDNSDAGFVKGGAPAGWRSVSGGQNGTMLWTYNNYSTQPYYNWARWYPSLAAYTWYDVYVNVPDLYTTTSKARYWVSHANGYSLRVVNQDTHGGQWVWLGTFKFRGTSLDYVSLADVTYEPYRTRLIGFDAIKWVKH